MENIKKENKVMLYTLSTCAHCIRTKNYFKNLNVGYDFIDFDTLSAEKIPEALANLGKYNPAETFPTVLIADIVIVGFLPEEFERNLKKFKIIS